MFEKTLKSGRKVTIKELSEDQIADLNFQKTQLLPFSGMTGRIRDMSDSANKS